MKFDLLLFDLDGTLLDADRSIRPATIDVLNELMARGVRVGFSTGRSPVSVRAYVDVLEPSGPLILFNGCVLWDVESNSARAGRRLPRGDAVRLVQATVDMNVHANVYIGRELYVRHRGRLSLESERKDGVPHIEVEDIVEFVRTHDEPPFKLLCIDESEDFSALTERFEQVLQSDCTLVNSEPTYLEVLPPGVNKGAMLDEIERHYGIPPGRVAVFGDELNDVELLQDAGHAVVMGNANPRVKPLGDIVIGRHDEDTIAEYLTELFEL
jgi:Cof subfamily protein (haloacid dehalogenase superfamily)